MTCNLQKLEPFSLLTIKRTRAADPISPLFSHVLLPGEAPLPSAMREEVKEEKGASADDNQIMLFNRDAC